MGFEPTLCRFLADSLFLVGVRELGTHDGSRTRTVTVLGSVPLPDWVREHAAERHDLPVDTPGGTRTRTQSGLNALPLPNWATGA